MTQQEALYNYCLRLGDDALIRSYRLSEWCSNAPILEEDLALTNFALDMIGRAQAMLSYAGQVEGKGRTDDDLAYKRNEKSFCNALMVELPNNNFAFTIARELYMSAYEFYLFGELAHSTDNTLAAIAAKTLKEVKYHLAHSSDWTRRLGDGTAISHEKMQQAINDLWPYTGELFENDKVNSTVTEFIKGPQQSDLYERWHTHIAGVLTESTLSVPDSTYMHTGGRKGVHTENMGHILSEMQFLQHAYPDAKW